MKLLSLNIEGGAADKTFFNYIQGKAKTTDIFCFQEVFSSKKPVKVNSGQRTDVFGELKKLLKDFEWLYLPVAVRAGEYFKIGSRVELCLAIFYRKNLSVEKHFGKHVYGTINSEVDFKNGKEANAVECAKFNSSKGNFWVFNFHGISKPGSKLDTKTRIKQSKTLIEVLKKLKGPKILCGDFNLMPNTQSIKIIEQTGLKNLIKLYKIKNTRNSISWKRYHNRQSFADFTFVSPDVKVENFKVPYVLASDHLPMILDYKIEN